MAIIPLDLLAQARDLLARAEEMSEIPAQEALLRTAVSRAYYAVYHEALGQARRQGYVRPPEGYASHDGLWVWWFVEESPDVRLADEGRLLKDERTLADYRLREPFTLARTRRIVDDARDAFDLARAQD